MNLQFVCSGVSMQHLEIRGEHWVRRHLEHYQDYSKYKSKIRRLKPFKNAICLLAFLYF